MGRAAEVRTSLFYPSEDVPDRWVAHCLDWDIVGTGDSPEEAFEELVELLELQVEIWDELGSQAASPDPAPRLYWEALKKAVALPPIDFSEHNERVLKKRAPHTPEKCKGALLHDRKLLAVGG